MLNSMRILLAGSLACLLLSACGNKEDTQSANSEANGNTYIIGLDDNFPPMGFRDDKNNIVGFDIDMATEAAKRAGINVDFKPIDWSAKESELQSKRVDMLWNGLTITPEREKNILFSKPYMENHQIIIVRPDKNIKTKADLKGKIIAVQDGSSAVDAIEADPISKEFGDLKKYGDNVTALLDLENKRVNALVVDEVVGRYYIAKKPNQFVVLEDNFGTEKYGVGFRKNDTNLQQEIQKGLDSMKADGTSAKISNKWFGKDIVE